MNKDFIRFGNLIFRISEITSISLHTDEPMGMESNKQDGWIIINKRTRINYLEFEDALNDYNKASILLAGEDMNNIAREKRCNSEVIYASKD